MGKYFGTDGFRGEANVVLTADSAYKTGRILGWYYSQNRNEKNDGEHARILIGKDTRRSSYMLEYALAAGITASGADAYLLHVTTTPSVSYAVRTEGFDCGIMITASHNPYYDNGIKIINGSGEKADDAVIELVEDYLDGKTEIGFAKRREIGRTVDYAVGRNRYIGYLISLGMYSLRGKKLGLDCANGSAWSIAKSVFDAMGAKTYVINNEPDGFNVNLNAGSTHIEGLRQLVTENGLDAGFAFDGDGDRCLCVDEKGNVLTGDHILYICGKFMKEKGTLHNNTVAATVMSNYGLHKAFEEIGIRCVTTPVGDKYVYDEIRQNGYMLGGEQSGHIIFSQYAATGDGILTGIKMMQVMLSRKLPMSRLAEGLNLYPQVMKSVPTDSAENVLENAAVKEAVHEAEELLQGRGRILVRKSGTEPVIRVMAESENEELCEKTVDSVIAAVKAAEWN